MNRRGVLLALGASMCGASAVQAQILPEERPFIEHRLVLQLSDDSEGKQHQVLNNAENVMKVFGPDKVAIEVVTFGPGITMLQEGNSNAEHIRSLKVQGVVFDVCQNTIDTWEKNNGKPFPISAQARRVPSGVAQIMTLVEHGYTPVRP